MSARHSEWAWRTPTSGTAKLILLAVADQGPAFHPEGVDIGTLVEMTGAGRRTIETALTRLALSSLLVPIRGADGRPGSTRYRLPQAADHGPAPAGRAGA